MRASKLLQHWDRVRSSLVETIDKFGDAELDFAPFDGGYTVRQLILHIAHEEHLEIQHGITRELDGFPPEYPATSYPTLADAKALLSQVHERTSRLLESLSDPQLDEEIEAGWGGKYVLEDMIWHVLEHEVHHRGELSLILGILGREGLNA